MNELEVDNIIENYFSVNEMYDVLSVNASFKKKWESLQNLNGRTKEELDKAREKFISDLVKFPSTVGFFSDFLLQIPVSASDRKILTVAFIRNSVKAYVVKEQIERLSQDSHPINLTLEERITVLDGVKEDFLNYERLSYRKGREYVCAKLMSAIFGFPYSDNSPLNEQNPNSPENLDSVVAELEKIPRYDEEYFVLIEKFVDCNELGIKAPEISEKQYERINLNTASDVEDDEPVQEDFETEERVEEKIPVIENESEVHDAESIFQCEEIKEEAVEPVSEEKTEEIVKTEIQEIKPDIKALRKAPPSEDFKRDLIEILNVNVKSLPKNYTVYDIYNKNFRKIPDGVQKHRLINDFLELKKNRMMRPLFFGLMHPVMNIKEIKMIRQAEDVLVNCYGVNPDKLKLDDEVQKLLKGRTEVIEKHYEKGDK